VLWAELGLADCWMGPDGAEPVCGALLAITPGVAKHGETANSGRDHAANGRRQERPKIEAAVAAEGEQNEDSAATAASIFGLS
jgi:hypothetical protein